MSDCLRSVAASGDRAAFEQLFRHFAPRVKAYLQRRGGESAAAEELMQETMVTIWRKAGQFDPSRSSAATWVFTIARNLRIDAYRHERHPEIDLNDPALLPDDEPAADALIETRQSAERVGAALANLSEGEQTILRLAFFEDETQSGISERLRLPLGTVKSRMRLAFGKLRKALADSTGETR
jgi:RNA polymerase sigma-70 factor, ECF subfamily